MFLISKVPLILKGADELRPAKPIKDKIDKRFWNTQKPLLHLEKNNNKNKK